MGGKKVKNLPFILFFNCTVFWRDNQVITLVIIESNHKQQNMCEVQVMLVMVATCG